MMTEVKKVLEGFEIPESFTVYDEKYTVTINNDPSEEPNVTLDDSKHNIRIDAVNRHGKRIPHSSIALSFTQVLVGIAINRGGLKVFTEEQVMQRVTGSFIAYMCTKQGKIEL